MTENKTENNISETSEVVKKNLDLLEKNQTSAKEIVKKQVKKKVVETNSILNRFLESPEERDERLTKIRAQDVIVTNEIQLKSFTIPDHQTIWASTDPKAKPSMLELKRRGYSVVTDVDYIATGSQSIEGAGFHIPMACPNDIAKRRRDALAKKSQDQYEQVFKKETLFKDGDKDFLYQNNKVEKLQD